MKRIEEYSVRIKEVLAEMTKDGWNTDFAVNSCMDAIEYEVDCMVELSREKET